MPEYSGTSERETVFVVALSNVSSDLGTGTSVAHFLIPFKFTLKKVVINVMTAPVGSAIAVDVNVSGQTIINDGLAISAGAYVSTTYQLVSGGNGTTGGGGTAVDSLTFDSGTAVTFDIVSVGSGTAGKVLKAYLYGSRQSDR